MEIFKEYIVFPVDYKSKIAFVSTEDSTKSWTFEVDWSFPLNEAKPKLFLDCGNEDTPKIQECDKQELSLHNIAVSEKRQLLAFTTSDKSVFLGKIEGSSFTFLSRRIFLRTISVLKFSSCGKLLFLADKTGDIYEYSCEDVNKQPRWIFGHISQILDLQITSPDSKFIVTTDRDEKIKVTNYPATHDIEAFCVGHTEFVSSAAFIDNERLLLSASGDKTLRLWNFTNGKQLQLINVEFVPNTIIASKTSEKGEGVLAISSDDKAIYVYRYFVDSDKFNINLLGQKSFSVDFDFALQDETFFIKHIHEVDGVKRLLLDKVTFTGFSVKFELLYDLTSVLQASLDPSFIIIKPFDTSLLFKKMFNNVESYLDRKRARLEKTQASKK